MFTPTNMSPLDSSTSSTTSPKKQSRENCIDMSLQDISLCSSVPICRICHCSGEEEPLIEPCRCSGSVRFAHETCLRTWIIGSTSTSCELCNYEFKTKKQRIKDIRKLHFCRPSLKGCLHISLFLAFFIMMVTSLTWIMWSQISNSKEAKAERSSKEVYYAYALNGGFVVMACVGLYLDSCTQFRSYYKKWCLLNERLVILPYDNEHDNKPSPVSSGSQSFIQESTRNLFTGMVQPVPTNYHCVQFNPQPQLSDEQWSTITSFRELGSHSCSRSLDQMVLRESRSAPSDLQYCAVLKESFV